MTHRITLTVVALLVLTACGSAQPTAGAASTTQTDKTNEQRTDDTGDAVESHDVSEERLFNATPEQVWASLSESAEIKEWWGPHGWTVPVANTDFREGGTTVVCMQAPDDGPTLCNTWRYRKIQPHSLIEYDLGWSDERGEPVDPAQIGLPVDVPETVPHRITLEDLGTGQTRMVITEFGYPSQETADISRSGLDEVLEKMAETFGRR
jgi:uncharacterized protein YndB with AHSA1/START domain